MSSNLMKLGGISISVTSGGIGAPRPYSQFTASELRNSTLMALSGQLKDPVRLKELEQELITRANNGTLPDGIFLSEQVAMEQPEPTVVIGMDNPTPVA